jgi:hypothetical protein
MISDKMVECTMVVALVISFFVTSAAERPQQHAAIGSFVCPSTRASISLRTSPEAFCMLADGERRQIATPIATCPARYAL